MFDFIGRDSSVIIDGRKVSLSDDWKLKRDLGGAMRGFEYNVVGSLQSPAKPMVNNIISNIKKTIPDSDRVLTLWKTGNILRRVYRIGQSAKEFAKKSVELFASMSNPITFAISSYKTIKAGFDLVSKVKEINTPDFYSAGLSLIIDRENFRQDYKMMFNQMIIPQIRNWNGTIINQGYNSDGAFEFSYKRPSILTTNIKKLIKSSSDSKALNIFSEIFSTLSINRFYYQPNKKRIYQLIISFPFYADSYTNNYKKFRMIAENFEK
ncbi:hypothetical protein [Candidatus Harpocratesius sp.]